MGSPASSGSARRSASTRYRRTRPHRAGGWCRAPSRSARACHPSADGRDHALDRGDVAGAAALRHEPASAAGARRQGCGTARRGRGPSGTSPSRARRRAARGDRQRGAEVRDDVRRRVRRTGARRSRAASTIDGDPSSAMTRPWGSRSSELLGDASRPQPASRTVSSPRSGSRSRTVGTPARHRVGDPVVGPPSQSRGAGRPSLNRSRSRLGAGRRSAGSSPGHRRRPLGRAGRSTRRPIP